jgi:hypothetical protein
LQGDGDAHPAEELDQASRGVVGEAQVETAGGLPGRVGGAREHRRLVLAQRDLDVVTVLDQRQRQLAGIAHRGVRALAGERRHQVGGVADQGHARDARPRVAGG